MKTNIKMLIGGILLTLGSSLLAEIPIRTSSNKDSEAAIAYNSTNDEYLVVWTEYTPQGSTTLPIMAQRVKGDGTGPIGSPFTVFPVGVYPSVAYNSQTNEYLVTAAAFGVVEAQRVGNTGTLVGGWSSLISVNVAVWPTIVYNSLDNSYLLIATTLYDAGFSLCNIKVHSLRVAANGQPGGNINLLRDQGYGLCADGSNYAIAYAPIIAQQTPKGRFLLTIETPADLTMLDHNGVIVSKVISSQSGTIVDDHVPFQQSKVGVAHNVDVAFGNWQGENVFMVVWGDIDQNVNNQEWTGIWAGIVEAAPIEFDADAGVSNTVFPVSKIPFHWATPAHAQTWQPAVAYNNIADKFMIAWRETPSTDPNNATKVNHIRANAVDSPAIPPPANIVISAATGTEDPKAAAIAPSTKNANALVVWEDARNFATTDIDLYGNLFNTAQAQSLILLEPNGGEQWYVGSQQDVWWSAQSFNGPVKIEYSTNGGSTWKTVTSSTTDQTFPWTIPDDPSSNCLVRISDAADGNPSDVSDAKFSILKAGLTLTSPNGGENWQVGSQKSITWTSQNIPDNDVTIELSTDNGVTYTPVGVLTNNQPSESYSWTVPNSPSTQCLIRISLFMQGVQVADVSNATFTISATQNTPTGNNVSVNLGNGTDIKFDNVSGAGNTTLNVKQTGSPPPNGFLIFPSGSPQYYNIETTATVSGIIEICIKYDDSTLTPVEESKLRFYVFETPPGKWKDITSSLDAQNNIICGQVNHLSEFAMMLGPVHFAFESNTGESYSIVIDNATLDGSQLTNGDEIGVFTPAGLCVGASLWDGTTPLALTAWADDSQTSLIDGYLAGDNMSFRIWDNSAPDEYLATATYSSGNGTFGNGAFARLSALNATTARTVDLTLSQGWSWLSFNIAPSDLSMDVVMAGVNNLVIVVDGAGQFYIPSVINSIGQMNPLEGYKIYLSGSEQISVTGEPVAVSTPISLQAGWNFVSYLPSASLAAETALASISANLAIAKNDSGKFFVPNLINSLGNMTPGEGYKLYLNADATLSYPQGASLAKVHINRLTTYSVGAKHFKFRPRTGESFSVVVKSSGDVFKPGDEIGIFTPAGLCVGAGVWDGSGMLGISAWADDDRTDIVDGFRPGERMQFKFWDADKNREAELNAAFVNGSDQFDAGAFAVVELESPTLPTTFSLRQNYPNPFNAGTVISYQLPESGKVTLKVYNLLGKQVRLLLNESQDAGAYSVHWDAKDDLGRFVPSGVYIYRIQAGIFSSVKKAVFVK